MAEPDTNRVVSESTLRRQRTTDKISPDGQYLPFYGYTIISSMANWKLLAHLESYIKNSKIISKFISALPASSYHITVFDIFTQRSIPQKYQPKSGNVPSAHWSNSLEALKIDLTEAQKKCEHLDGEIIFQSEKIVLGKTGLSVIGILSNRAEISKLRDECSVLFKSSKDQVFHLSLGYIYSDITDKDMEGIKKELEGLWDLIQNSCYKLNKPHVCYFETMEEFIPYNNLVFM